MQDFWTITFKSGGYSRYKMEFLSLLGRIPGSLGEKAQRPSLPASKAGEQLAVTRSSQAHSICSVPAFLAVGRQLATERAGFITGTIVNRRLDEHVNKAVNAEKHRTRRLPQKHRTMQGCSRSCFPVSPGNEPASSPQKSKRIFGSTVGRPPTRVRDCLKPRAFAFRTWKAWTKSRARLMVVIS